MGKLGETFIELKGDTQKLKESLRDALKSTEQKAKEMQDAFRKQKMDIDTRLMKLKLSDVQKIQKALQIQLQKKIAMNADMASIERTRTSLQSVNNALRDTQTNVEKANKGWMKKAAVAGAAFLVIRKGWQVLKESIQLSFEQAKAEAKVEQAVRQTGMAAGFTANQLKAMASEIQDIYGIGDEKILTDVTNQLLSFTAISGESFRRAQIAAMDLATVIGTDLRSQTIQLGKALEDPVRGMQALRRSGVTFTAEQEKQVRTLVRTNDLMGAQKIILDEVNNKYGGQAKAISEATRGTMQFNAAYGDLKETAGSFFQVIISDWSPTLTKAIKGWILLLGGFESAFKRISGLSADNAIGAMKKSLKGSTKEFLEEEKKAAETRLRINKEWYEVEKALAGKNLLGMQRVTDEMKKYQNLIDTDRALLTSIGQLQTETSNLKSDVWDGYGASIEEIEGRVVELQEKLKQLSPDLDKVQIALINKEIDALTAKISFGGKKESTFQPNRLSGKTAEQVFNESFMGRTGRPRDRKIIPDITSPALRGKTAEQVFEENSKLAESFKRIPERYTEEQLKAIDATENFAGTLSSGLMQGITSGKTLGETFKNIGVQLASMVAEALIFKGIMAMLGMGTGGAGSFLSLLGFSGGGSVVNRGGSISARGGIPKFARGGSFTVPNGFPNDSFPIMVQSGERVDITPANQNFNDRNIVGKLDAVNGSIQALSMAIIKDRISTKGGRDGSMDMLKSLTKIITKESNAFERDNVKVNR